MSEVGFTRGPWRVFEDVRTDKSPYGRDSEEYIAGFNIESENYEVVGCEGISGGSETERANAHLIAAAPDLYSGLEEVSDLLECCPRGAFIDTTQITGMRERLKRALAKARGETP